MGRQRSIRHLLGLIMLLLGSAVLVVADQVGYEQLDVFATVDPNVSMGSGSDSLPSGVDNTPPPPPSYGTSSGTKDLGHIQTGNLVGTLCFRVDANMQQIGLFATATPLFKGGNPRNTDVCPIPLLANAGIRIAPKLAGTIGGRSNIACYTTQTTLDGFPAQSTETIGFESSQNNRFSQDVQVTVVWVQDDPEKPTGEYSGKVRLTAVVLPN